MTTRRSFLKSIGLGGVAAITTAAVPAAAVKEVVQTKVNFQFQCACGNEVVAEEAKEKGEKLSIACACGKAYRLTWHGDHWSVSEGTIVKRRKSKSKNA